MVELECRRPLLLRVKALCIRLRRQRGVVAGVPLPHGVLVVGGRQLLARVLANRLEKEEAAVAQCLQQARVLERRHRVEVGAADLLGRGEREAAREDPELSEEPLARIVEKLVAPGERLAQRALARRRVACARRQQRQSAVEPMQQLVGTEQTRARGGELDRERQAIEAAADGVDRLRMASA